MQLEYVVLAKVSVSVHHDFSVEKEQSKRDFICAAHHAGETNMHLFGDVDIFHSPDEEHHCFTCNRAHKLPDNVDILASGPSCKKISRMNCKRVNYVGGFLAPSFQVLFVAFFIW